MIQGQDSGIQANYSFFFEEKSVTELVLFQTSTANDIAIEEVCSLYKCVQFRLSKGVKVGSQYMYVTHHVVSHRGVKNPRLNRLEFYVFLRHVAMRCNVPSHQVHNTRREHDKKRCNTHANAHSINATRHVYIVKPP